MNEFLKTALAGVIVGSLHTAGLPALRAQGGMEAAALTRASRWSYKHFYPPHKRFYPEGQGERG